jgi:hypothetical protein
VLEYEEGCGAKVYETNRSYMHLDKVTSVMGVCGLQRDDVLDALWCFNNMGMLLWHEEEV